MPVTSTLSQFVPVTQKIGIYQDDSFTLIVGVQDSDSNPVALTGATALAQIRDLDGDLLDTFTPAVDEENGLITLTLSSAQTAALPIGNIKSDIQITVGSIVTTYMILKIKVYPDISRS